jgi:predicted signal transduction protein with EAL and GGDEF domain
LIGAENLAVPEKWRMLEELFAIRPPIVATGAIASVAVTSAGHRIPTTLWLWIGLAVLACFGRVMLSRRFQGRTASDEPARWEMRFLAAAALSGIVWGFGAVVIAETSEPLLELAILAVACALMSGASARSYCAPMATLSQISLACGSFSAAFAVRHQWGLIVTLTLYLAFQYSVVRDLGRSALARISAESQRAQLNEQLLQANKNLERMALTDSLTGLANRRRLLQAIQ